MLKGKIITLAITSFILFSSVSFLTENMNSASGTKVVVIPGINNLTTGNLAHFTVYSNPQSSSSPLLEYTLENLGISWHNTGSIWTFTVPGNMAKKVILQMNLLTNISGIRYFETGGNLVTFPSVQFLNYTPSQGVPFAYVPSQISTAYNFTWALSHGINGKGQTIVIVDAYGDPNIAYDLKAFDAVSGLPAVNLSVEYPVGRPSSDNLTWAIETSTDVEWAHALAPEAKIVLLISPTALTSDLQKVVSYAVNNNVGNIISLSWGSPESQLGTYGISTYSEIYREASLKNITVFAASGDSGAHDGTKSLTVNFPASNPYVTGVGGTSLYFSNGQLRQSAWGGNFSGENYGSGGGYSGYFHAPYWQSAPGFSSAQRGVPDVSMVADQYTGMLVISGGAQYKVGGTSIATPIWADVAALIKEKSGTNFGMINPLLYQLSGSKYYNSTFTQILTGTNGYYHAGPGWNPVTGLGTPNVSSLVNYSRDLIRGYGGFALMNGSTNYNATGMSAHLNVNLQPGRIESNGTTTYYIGLYSNSHNFMRFGVSVTNSSQNLSFYVRQGDNRLERNYTSPVAPSNGVLSLDFSFNYSNGNNITISSGAFHDSYHVLLGFGGSASPYAGVQQTGSLTNSTIIGVGNFSRISLYTNGTAENVGSILYVPYSHLGAYRYSTIDSKFNNGNLTFYTGQYSSQRYINGSAPAKPLILFNETFQNPINAAFSISNGKQAAWAVDGVPLTGNSKTFTSNGYYNVTASISGLTVSRVIYIPGVRDLNLSLNTGLSFYKTVDSEILVNWLNTFRSQQQSVILPILNNTNSILVMSQGFRDQQVNVSAGNLTINLIPNPVNVSFFVFPSSSSVNINNGIIAQAGGWHYAMVMPSDNLNVSISSRGYRDFNETLTVYPGTGISYQIELAPASPSEVSISGKVSDALYSFEIPGTNVSNGNGTYSFTNSSGYYIIYSEKGGYNVTANATLYNAYNSEVNLSENSTLDILLKPARVAINTTNLIGISRYFPLLFYFGYLSWTQYSGGNFYSYSVYVSNNPDFFNPKVYSYTSQNTTTALLTGLTPGQTYYVTVILRLSNDQIYESQVVKISYGDPVYLGANIVLVGGIIFYVALAMKIFGKKKKKYDF